MQDKGNYITKYADDIKKKAQFLEKKGFSIVDISEYIIEYSSGNNCKIGIYYGRYSDAADVYTL